MPGSPTIRATLVGLLSLAAGLGLLGAPPARARARTRSAHVTLALTPRDPAALGAYVRAVATPGSPLYGHYLTPAAFAARFGAPARRIAAVRRALRARGLAPRATSAGGLSIAVTGSPEALRDALATPGPATARAHSARLPGVQAIVGLDPRARARPLAVRAATGVRAAPLAPAARIGSGVRARSEAAGASPCSAAASAAPQQSAYTDDAIAAAYDFDPLYAAGDTGRGTTVAVYELEPDDPHDIATFQSCFGTHARISYVHVDGGAGSGPGSDEAAFDIENLIGFAPGVRVLVYQGPNMNSGEPGSGPYDTFSAIVNQDRAQVVSVSWGQCEAQLGRSSATAEHTLFEQAAAEGQTIVAAAGDFGSEDCDTGGHGSSTRLAVDDPGSQPTVLGVGGTTLHIGTPSTQSAWNSGGSADALQYASGAGGGGISSLWAMAPDQRQAPARLHVLRSAAAGAACGESGGYCREAPDVAADADPSTGYEIYWNGADTVPEPSGWQGLGGTSGAAPLWAGLLALADAAPACHGTPLGEVGPAVYRAAASAYRADFDDVTTGDNDFTGSGGGRWPAAAGYDLTTGLGTPHAAALVRSLCADAVHLGGLADQSSALGAGVALRLRGGDVRGRRLTYTASHLPAGVHLDASSGRLTGAPRQPGAFHVRVGVGDDQGESTVRRFTWGIGGAPRLGSAIVRGGRLGLTVTSARRGPTVRVIVLRLPGGLRPGAARLVRVAGSRAAVRVSGSSVRIALPLPRRSARLTIPVTGVAGGVLHASVQTGTTGASSLTAPIR